MILGSERWVIFMRAYVDWAPKNAPRDKLDMLDVAKRLKAVANTAKGVLVVDIKNPAGTLSIDQVDLVPADDPKHACILFTYSDSRGADPGFQNLETRTRRIEAKRSKEANAASAHLVISLKAVSRKGQTYYPAVLEDMTSVGKTKIAPAVTRVLRASGNFTFEDEQGNNAGMRPRFVLEAQDDEQVQKDASKGTISYFRVVKDEKTQPAFDEQGQFRVSSRTARIKPAAGGGGLLQQVKSLWQAAKAKDYDRIQVVYRRADGKSRSVTYGTHREDAEDFLIKRIEKIELDAPLAQTSEKISRDLRKRMINALSVHQAKGK